MIQAQSTSNYCKKVYNIDTKNFAAEAIILSVLSTISLEIKKRALAWIEE